MTYRKCRLVNQNINDRRLRNPTPLILDWFEGTPPPPYKGQNNKVF